VLKQTSGSHAPWPSAERVNADEVADDGRRPSGRSNHIVDRVALVNARELWEWEVWLPSCGVDDGIQVSLSSVNSILSELI
jgi:hypothetical protein